MIRKGYQIVTESSMLERRVGMSGASSVHLGPADTADEV